jgi:hypothetical protein
VLVFLTVQTVSITIYTPKKKKKRKRRKKGPPNANRTGNLKKDSRTHGRSVTVTEVKETEGSTVKGKTVIQDMKVYGSRGH